MDSAKIFWGFSENNYKSYFYRGLKRKNHRASLFLTRSNQEQAYILTYFSLSYPLPTPKKSYPVQIGQTKLFRGSKNMWLVILQSSTAPSILRNYLSLGKWGLQINTQAAITERLHLIDKNEVENKISWAFENSKLDSSGTPSLTMPHVQILPQSFHTQGIKHSHIWANGCPYLNNHGLLSSPHRPVAIC